MLENINKLNKFYVYGIYSEDDNLLYIGKGCGDRAYSHLLGSSSNSFINQRHFEGDNMSARKFSDNLSEERALVLEAQLINIEKPPFNKVKPKITKELYQEACKDLKMTLTYERSVSEQESYLVEDGCNPLVWVKRSPNYQGLSHLRFPMELPLKWCDDHYRLEGKDLVNYGYDFDKPDSISVDESLYIPPYCI